MENETRIIDYANKIKTRANGYSEVENIDIPLVEGKGRKAHLTEAGKRAAASYAYALISAPEVLELPGIETNFDWARENLNNERNSTEDQEFRDYARLLNSSLRMRERHLRNSVCNNQKMENFDAEVPVKEPEVDNKPQFVGLEQMKNKLVELKGKAKEIWEDVSDYSRDHLPNTAKSWGVLAVGIFGAVLAGKFIYDRNDQAVDAAWAREVNRPAIVAESNVVVERLEPVVPASARNDVFGPDSSAPEIKPSATPTVRPPNTPEPSPTPTIEAPNYYSWIEQRVGSGESLNLSESFKLVLPADTMAVYGEKNPVEFIPARIDVHSYNSPQEAVEANWGANFERSSLESKNDVAIQQGNNDRALVYGHSGSVLGFKWPFEFVKNATWYEEEIVGKTIEFYQGNMKYVYRIEQVTTVTKTEFESASRQFSDPNRPLMKDLVSLGVDENIANQPGIDFVACGGKQVSLKDHRTILSTVLISQERVGVEEVTAANYYSSEYAPEILPNMMKAAELVNADLEADPIQPGETWSYLDAVDYFSGNEWIAGSTFIKGAGGCDVATMMFRAVQNYSKALGLPFEKIGQEGTAEIWGNAMFRVVKYPHSDYPGKPADEVAVQSFSGVESAGNADMTITIADHVGGVPLPEDMEFRMVVVKDENGNFKVVSSSNYSAEELRKMIELGVVVER